MAELPLPEVSPGEPAVSGLMRAASRRRLPSALVSVSIHVITLCCLPGYQASLAATEGERAPIITALAALPLRALFPSRTATVCRLPR